MTGENLKEGLEGLSKIENISDNLYVIIYWLAVIFIILFVGYIFSVVNCHINKKRRGGQGYDNDDFLDD